MAAVEAEAGVLARMIMRIIHVVGMVLEEETTIATMIEAGGLEAEVLVAEVGEAEALGEGETGVQLGKAVWRGGQK